MLLDWESPETSATFQHFGSSLEPNQAPVIANPDMSGINMSAMVVEHVKPANSTDFAGTFKAAGLDAGIDLTTANQLCFDIWRSNGGSFTVKLENGVDGAANWQRTQSTDVTNEWVTLCYDLTLPGEVNGDVAFGNVYNGMALFADLGTVFTEDQVNYIDNFTINQAAQMDVDVTFAVDMAGYSGSFTTVYVSGSFNGWSGDANPLSDDDNDGIWMGTITVPTGATEWKFQVDQWTDQEQFGDKYYECTIVDPSGQFVNRYAVIANAMDMDAVCWNSCFACGEAVDLTFNVGTGNITVDTAGIFIAGGGNFGNPGDFPLSDADGDGVYTGTFERQMGFESFYTITNGACPDYSCKEDISGQDCANPNNFNDRNIDALDGNTSISTCFAVCTTDLSDCETTNTTELSAIGVDFRVRPTVVQSELIVSFGAAALPNGATLDVVNTLGQLIERNLVGGQTQTSLDLANLQTGMYFVRLTVGTHTGTLRVLKN